MIISSLGPPGTRIATHPPKVMNHLKKYLYKDIFVWEHHHDVLTRKYPMPQRQYSQKQELIDLFTLINLSFSLSTIKDILSNEQWEFWMVFTLTIISNHPAGGCWRLATTSTTTNEIQESSKWTHFFKKMKINTWTINTVSCKQLNSQCFTVMSLF